MSDLQVVPLTVEQAMFFLKQNERHYKSDATPLFALGIALAGSDELCGAAVIGVRGSDTELCHIYSTGEYTGYTTLYGASWRAAKAMGYKRMIL